MSKKRAFITGITGFVGSHLAEYLLRQDIEVHGLLRWRSPKDNIVHCLRCVHLHYGDLTDYVSLEKILAGVLPDYVFHLAAQSVAEDEFIPILKSKEMGVYTFEELWKTCLKKRKVRYITINGVDTEVIDINSQQIRAIGFFNGMGNWVPIKQISRHKYKGEIVKMSQKFGSLHVTPNHCVVDKFGKLCTPMENPDLLPIRKLNYYNKKKLNQVKLVRTCRFMSDDYSFWIDSVPNKKLPICFKDEKLKAFVNFCAAYISEGCAHSRKKKRNFTVTISNGDKKWLDNRNEEIRCFADGMEGKYATGKKDGYEDVYGLTVTSELLYYVMIRCCGKGSHQKKMPNFIFQLSENLQQEFLRRLAEGDGCYVQRKNYETVRYTTSSRKLASQVCFLLTLLHKDYTVHEADDSFFIRECAYYQPNQGISKKKTTMISYNGYVYDISVGKPELFAAGIGSLVIHNSLVPYSFDAPIATLDVNCQGTCNLLEVIKNLRTDTFDPITHICSSSEIYGQVREEDIPINESCPFRPASPYAVSKVCEDMLAYQYWISWGIKTIRTRMFTHTGNRRNENFVVSNFAKQIAEIELGRQPPVVWVGNLDSVRTFADVRDAVRAYWLLIQHCDPGEAYNIGGNTTMTIGEMLDKLISLSECQNIQIEADESRLRPSDVTLQIPDIRKFQQKTNWKPEIKFEDTLKSILDYWRDCLRKNHSATC